MAAVFACAEDTFQLGSWKRSSDRPELGERALAAQVHIGGIQVLKAARRCLDEDLVVRFLTQVLPSAPPREDSEDEAGPQNSGSA